MSGACYAVLPCSVKAHKSHAEDAIKAADDPLLDARAENLAMIVEINRGRDGMATDPANYSRERLIERARGVVPQLRECAAAGNAAGRIAADTIEVLWDAELFYLLKPRKFGGPETRVDVAFEIAGELARGDGSAAWVWTVMGVHDLFLSLFPEEAQHEYWAKDRTLSASSFAPHGKVTPARGGFTLSGRWSFCSGVDNAQWMILGAVASMLSTEPPIPDIRFLLLPRSDCQIIDDWNVLGLRGTGSKTVAVENVFVPDHRIVKNEDLVNGTAPGGRLHESSLYRAPVWAVFPFCISSPANGIARGAFESYVDEMKARTSAFDHSPLAKKPTIQLRLAEAGALIDAGDLLYKRSLRETIDQIMAGKPLSLEHRVRSRRDQGYSVQMARRATELLLGAEGGKGLYEGSHVQRAFRDLQALSAHIVGGWDMPALNYGQVILGGPPTDPFF
jgi:alkylation response protein AidB-like acyl-CoA dehydrogenase